MISGLLSQVLVAFTIELDNEFEHRMPHRTARGPAAHSGRGPWLVSLPMWQNYLRWLPDGADQAKLVNLGGLKRWSYVEDDGVTLTRAGRAANKVWTGLPEEIEARWEVRYGDLTPLRAALGEHPDLPWALPVAGPSRVDRPVWTRGLGPDLPGRLSQTLQAYARDYERESRLSLAVSANVLRALTPDGVALRDLPVRTGVSKEAVSVSVGFLERVDCVTVVARVARLTEKGQKAQAKYRRLVGGERDDRLRAVLKGLLADPEKLRQGLTPHPDGWRAHPPYTAVTRALLADPAAVLPRYPMVSHRGGFPDGS